MKQVPPERILIYVPVAYAQFREIAKSVLPRELPPDIGVSRFVTFGPDWTPQIIPRRVGAFDMQIVGGQATTIRKELATVLERAGALRSTAGRRLLGCLGWLIVILLFFAGVIWATAKMAGFH